MCQSGCVISHRREESCFIIHSQTRISFAAHTTEFARLALRTEISGCIPSSALIVVPDLRHWERYLVAQARTVSRELDLWIASRRDLSEEEAISEFVTKKTPAVRGVVEVSSRSLRDQRIVRPCNDGFGESGLLTTGWT